MFWLNKKSYFFICFH